MSKPSPITVYNLLPKKNCGECGVPTCMAFAVELIEGKADLKKCPHLTDEQERKLEGLISPPIKTVFVGRRRLPIGGERVLHRHELKFFNPTAMFVRVSDSLDDEVIKERIKEIKKIGLERAGEKFGLDGIALSADSGDSRRFEEAAGMVNEFAGLPLVLCADEPNVIRGATEVVAEDKPILYSAKPNTVKSFVEISKSHGCPLVLESGELGELRTMVGAAKGVELLLNPTPSPLNPTKLLSNVVAVRRCGIEFKMSEFSHPILVAPGLMFNEASAQEAGWLETLTSSALLIRYADALILRSTAIEHLLPLFVLRQSVYADPKSPSTVPQGLYEVGKPNAGSPVLLTTNYALTYYLVSGDLESSGVNCYLLVADTQGMSVLNALAGGLLPPDSIKKLIDETKVEEKVSHRTLIIPGGLAKLKWEIEEATGWEVTVGPMESSEIPSFLKEKLKN